MYSLQILDGTLIIKENKTGEIKWSGKPYDCTVKMALPINEQSEFIILLDYYEFSLNAYRSRGNLLLINCLGEIIWHAELPTYSDSYVSIEFQVGKISAHSWEGFWVHINANNGKIIDKIFTG